MSCGVACPGCDQCARLRARYPVLVAELKAVKKETEGGCDSDISGALEAVWFWMFCRARHWKASA